MPDILIHRDHALGLERAREVAWRWAEDVEAKFGMECTVLEGEDTDTVEFRRSGVAGTLEVAADRFTLEAKLGLLMGAFAGQIEAEIEKNLDGLLAREARRGKAAAKSTPARAAGATPKKAPRRKA
jgi:putative polyhydroxyalkanoate system protein